MTVLRKVHFRSSEPVFDSQYLSTRKFERIFYKEKEYGW